MRMQKITATTIAAGWFLSLLLGFASPSQGSCSVAEATLTCQLGSLAVGESAMVTVIVTPESAIAGGMVLGQKVSVRADQTDPTPDNSVTMTASVVG